MRTDDISRYLRSEILVKSLFLSSAARLARARQEKESLAVIG